MTFSEQPLDRREMFAEIKKLCRPDNWRNWFILFREWGVFALTVAACMGWYHFVAGQGWSVLWVAPVYLLSILVIGIWTQNRLACLVHESSHYLLFKNRVLNDIAANLFVVFPFFGTIANYRIGHWGHHRHVNNAEKDPDLIRLRQHHPRQFPISRSRFLWEYVLLQLMPHKAFTYLKGRASYVTLTMKHQRVKGQDALGTRLTWLLRIGYYGALVGILSWYGWWPHYLLFWIVPLLTFYPATLFLREIAHHGNYPDDGDFTNSRVYEGYWLEREIFFPFGEHNHVLHHLFPTVPWHKTRAAHAVMMRYAPYREQVVTCDGFFFKRRDNDQPRVLDLLAEPAHSCQRNPPVQDAGLIRQATAVDVGDLDVVADTRQQGES